MISPRFGKKVILFNDEMFKEVLSGRKTQTRRRLIFDSVECPYGKVGDKLWSPFPYPPIPLEQNGKIILEITAVRNERLNDITKADVIKEGCPQDILYGIGWYKNLWESIYGIGSWNDNPLVWVIDFKKIFC